MASGILISFRPAGIRACATPRSDRRSEGRWRSSPPRGGGGGSSSGSWWSPLFGWPSEPDYIDGEAEKQASGGEVHRPTRRFVAFTEEKARELRMRTTETETFHDAMYHSAIASRLASDLPRRSDL